MSDADANSADPDTQERQYLMDIIAQLEDRLQNALTTINSYHYCHFIREN
jgi:hypothetical protein